MVEFHFVEVTVFLICFAEQAQGQKEEDKELQFKILGVVAEIMLDGSTPPPCLPFLAHLFQKAAPVCLADSPDAKVGISCVV